MRARWLPALQAVAGRTKRRSPSGRLMLCEGVPLIEEAEEIPSLDVLAQAAISVASTSTACSRR